MNGPQAVPPEPKRKRRTKEEIAAEKRAWLMRHDWDGVKAAVDLLEKAREATEEAVAAEAGKVTGTAAIMTQAAKLLAEARERLSGGIPMGAR